MIEELAPEYRSLDAKKAVEILAKHGTEISLEKARIVLEFIYKFSNLSWNQAKLQAIKPEIAGQVRKQSHEFKKQKR